MKDINRSLGRRLGALLFTALIASSLSGAPQPAGAGEGVMFILDASGSMWAEMGDGHRITVARDAMDEVIADLPEITRLGLVAYGHRSRGDCDDIELLIEPGEMDREAFLRTVQEINPRGMTPIAASVEHAVEVLRDHEGRHTLVLLSDGLENCGGDPCAAVHAAREAGLDFVMHVIGFALGDADPGQLQCMAKAGGGGYFSADSAAELIGALGQAVETLPGLALEVVANGTPAPARVYVYDAESGQEVARGRVGETPGPPYPNPLRLDLPTGDYHVRVVPMAIDGHPGTRLTGITIPAEGEIERRVDFSSGQLEVHVTANGEPIRARTYVNHADSGDEAARARADENGPARYNLPSGGYRIHITPDGVAAPKQVIEGVAIAAGETVRRTLDFTVGRLEITVTANGAPLKARTYVTREETGREADRGRTDREGRVAYKPLPVGRYRIRVRPDGINAPDRVIEDLTVTAGETTRAAVDFTAEPDS